MKMEFGCSSDALIPVEMDGELMTRCPRRPIFDNPTLYVDLFRMYSDRSRGMLPDRGSTEDQSNAYNVCMRIIEQALGEVERDKAEKQRQAQAAKNRGFTKKGTAPRSARRGR